MSFLSLETSSRYVTFTINQKQNENDAALGGLVKNVIEFLIFIFVSYNITKKHESSKVRKVWPIVMQNTLVMFRVHICIIQ